MFSLDTRGTVTPMLNTRIHPSIHPSKLDHPSLNTSPLQNHPSQRTSPKNRSRSPAHASMRRLHGVPSRARSTWDTCPPHRVGERPPRLSLGGWASTRRTPPCLRRCLGVPPEACILRIRDWWRSPVDRTSRDGLVWTLR